MKRIIFPILILCALSGEAQQYPESQMYMVNTYIINPGFTGYLTDFSAYAGAFSPITSDNHVVRGYQVGVNKSFEKRDMAVGGKLVYDQRDFFKSTYIDLSMSYQMVLGKTQVLSLGSDLGLVNRTYDIGELSPLVDLRDPTLSSDYYFSTNFKLGFGLAYYSTVIEACFSLPQMVEGSAGFRSYYNAFFAYKHYFANDFWIAKPNIYYIKYPDGTFQFAGNLMLAKRGIFWGQVGGTSNKGVSLATGITFNESYEITFSHLHQLQSQLVNSSRSEIMLQIHLSQSNRRLSHIGHKRNRR